MRGGRLGAGVGIGPGVARAAVDSAVRRVVEAGVNEPARGDGRRLDRPVAGDDGALGTDVVATRGVSVVVTLSARRLPWAEQAARPPIRPAARPAAARSPGRPGDPARERAGVLGEARVVLQGKAEIDRPQRIVELARLEAVADRGRPAQGPAINRVVANPPRRPPAFLPTRDGQGMARGAVGVVPDRLIIALAPRGSSR